MILSWRSGWIGGGSYGGSLTIWLARSGVANVFHELSDFENTRKLVPQYVYVIEAKLKKF